MNKKGFTLIELLAVIVILAIIALIATPIILNIISDAKEESNERSVELYGKAVEQAIAKAQLNGTEVQAGDLSDNLLSSVQYSGSEVTCTTNKLYEDGSIYLEGCNGEYTYGVRQYAYMWTYNYFDVYGPSIGEDASSLSTSVPTDKIAYLKFKLDSENKVKESYACVVYGDSRKEICLRGESPEFYGWAGTGEYDEFGYELPDYEKFTGNLLILKGLESEGFECWFTNNESSCAYTSEAQTINIYSYPGGPRVMDDDSVCDVNTDDDSYCGTGYY